MSDSPAKRGRGAPPGNRNRVTHGAGAQVPATRLNATVQQVYAALADDAPVRGPDGGLPRHDREAVALLARALCRLEDVTAWLDKRGVVAHSGRLRSRVLDQEAKLRREVQSYLEDLGMTPRARAKLGVDFAHQQSLASRMAEADDFIDADADDE